MKYAKRWEEAQNKPAIVGGFAAAAVALWLGESISHLPVLNFLIGEPLRLLGLFTLVPLAIRYFVEKKDLEKDIEEQVGKVLGLLLKK
jgi:hypothetical protein